MRFVHGDYGSAEYYAWAHIIQRCTNPKDKRYHLYGGRGILVCDSWKEYSNFLKDMGRKPSAEYSIDRIDNNKGYYPANCRWATREQQDANLQRSIKVPWDGEILSLTQLCKKLGINYRNALHRYKRGFPLETVLSPKKLNWRGQTLAALFTILSFCSIAHAQPSEIQPGCYISFDTYQCQEPEENFLWVNYGPEENKVIYGTPVAALINQAVEDRALLEEWIQYAEKLEKRIKLWKRRARSR